MRFYQTVFFLTIFFNSGIVLSQKYDLLENAYQKNSPELLKKFLDNWATQIKPISQKDLNSQSKIVQHTYQIFQVLFNPHNIGELGVEQARYDGYQAYNYFLIPQKTYLFRAKKVYYSYDEKLLYTIESIKKNVPIDSLIPIFIDRVIQKKEDKGLYDSYGPYGTFYKDSTSKLVDSIVNFRPIPSRVLGTSLYLNSEYEQILTKFLGNTHIPFATNGPENIAQASGESKNRMEFLQNYIKIAYGHWGGNWELATPPTILWITFDAETKFAKVNYKLMYEGGIAFLKFENKQWKLISANRTWQE